MEARKRTRSINWTEEEKKVLRMLVLECADIIENKDTSTNTNSAKKDAWEKVSSRFNAFSTNKRDVNQLLTQWRNMKNKAKKTENASRNSGTVTCGGSSSPGSSNEDQELTIPHEFAVNVSCYDNNTINIKEEKLLTSCDEIPAPYLPKKLQVGLKKSVPSYPVSKKQKKKSACCRVSHEHQLFILAKTAREEAMQRERKAHELKMINERELHERRLALMALEEDYWKLKIRNRK